MKTQRAFTLIELLVVIGIIGVLGGIVLVALGAARDRAIIARAQMFSNSLKGGLDDAIIGWWSFDDCTARDPWGNNDGTIAGAICVQGILRNALSFDGVDDHVLTTMDYDFGGSTQLTVEVWIRPGKDYRDEPNDWFYFTNKGFDQPFEFGYQGWGDSVAFKPYNAATDFQVGETGGTYLDQDRWYHYVGVVNGNFIGLYKNGKLVDSRNDFTGTLRAGTAVVVIGGTETVRFFSGFIDEVVIYSRGFTVFEIQKHYAEGLEKRKNLALQEP
ncbi:LamG domain-containing protein [Patescibacteria group bacterium]|nr:LamG domain-containing protein [Patescibacteria group bacterium]